MGLHLMASDHKLTAIMGVACCERALRDLRDAAVQEGDIDSVKKYDADLAALDAEFDRIKKIPEEKPSFFEILDAVGKD